MFPGYHVFLLLRPLALPTVRVPAGEAQLTRDHQRPVTSHLMLRWPPRGPSLAEQFWTGVLCETVPPNGSRHSSLNLQYSARDLACPGAEEMILLAVLVGSVRFSGQRG
jgi:hypothetical protein